MTTKVVIFDADGLVIRRGSYFSERFSRDFRVPAEIILPFFKDEFQRCLVGKADLKEELAKRFPAWGWKGSIDDLLAYWFEGERDLDERVLRSVERLRAKKVRCFLATNNEEYRVRYLSETLGLGKVFDDVFSSTRLGCLKSEPTFWRLVHEALGRPKKDSVLVWDDDEKNVASAEHFGFHSEFYSGFEAYQRRMESFVG